MNFYQSMFYSKRKRTDSSTEDDTAEPHNIDTPPVESEKELIAADLAANSSVVQQPKSPMAQSEVDGVLRRISLEVQRLNADLMQKDVDLRAAKLSDSLEIRRLKQELRAKDVKLGNTQIRLTQCESDKFKYATLHKEEFVKLKLFQVEANREKSKLQEEVEEKSTEIVRLKGICTSHYEEEVNELRRKGKADLKTVRSQLTKAKTLQAKNLQLYNDETAKLTAVQQQFEAEKEKNRQKDQQLLELQKELTEKSAEIYSKSGEILKLRQNGQSLSDQLGLKTEQNSAERPTNT